LTRVHHPLHRNFEKDGAPFLITWQDDNLSGSSGSSGGGGNDDIKMVGVIMMMVER